MFPPREDILRLMPEIILSLSGILLMLVEPLLTRARRNVLVSAGRARQRPGARLHDLSGDASRHGIFRLAAH